MISDECSPWDDTQVDQSGKGAPDDLYLPSPTHVSLLTGVTKSVAASRATAYSLLTTGQVYSWGRINVRQLDTAFTVTWTSTPALVTFVGARVISSIFSFNTLSIWWTLSLALQCSPRIRACAPAEAPVTRMTFAPVMPDIMARTVPTRSALVVTPPIRTCAQATANVSSWTSAYVMRVTRAPDANQRTLAYCTHPESIPMVTWPITWH